MGVAEDEPPGEGGVGPGELALDGVLGQDQHRLAAHLTSPREGLGLQHNSKLDKTLKFIFDNFLSFQSGFYHTTMHTALLVTHIASLQLVGEEDLEEVPVLLAGQLLVLHQSEVTIVVT